MVFYYLPAQGLPISVQARLSGRSRSSFYYKRKQPKKDALLLERIQAIHCAHPFYGYKRMAQELCVNHKRTYRLMKRHGIRARSSRKKHAKNQYSSSKTSLPNVLKDMTITAPNQVWAGDFTHFTWKRRTFYLATVIDQYTRQVVGWHVAANHSTELVVEALQMALGRRSKAPQLFHSDHGSEYIGEEFVANLKHHGITPSNSAKGKPWQNGIQESFYFRFKEEFGDFNRFTTFDALFEELCRHFKIYNTTRIHSALKMSPDAFYEKAMQVRARETHASKPS